MTKKSRKNERAAVSLSARYRSPTAFEFVTEEASDLSNGGMFIRSLQPAPAGTLLKLEVEVDGGTETIRGVARVVWLRLEDMGGEPAGMGVKFVKLEPGGRQIIQDVLDRLGVHEELPAGRSTWTPSEPPPMPRFSAVPTRSSFAPTRRSAEPTPPRTSAVTQQISAAAPSRPSTMPLGTLQQSASGDASSRTSANAAPADDAGRASRQGAAANTGRTLMMSALSGAAAPPRDTATHSLPAGILATAAAGAEQHNPEPPPPEAESGSIAQAVWEATEPFENAESLVSEVPADDAAERDSAQAFDQAPTGEIATADPWQDAVAAQSTSTDEPARPPESVRPGRPDSRDLRERLRHHRKATSDAPPAHGEYVEQTVDGDHAADAAKAEDAWHAITRESLADAEAARAAMERGSAPLEADALATSADAERRAERISALPREVPKSREGSPGKMVAIGVSVVLMIAAGVIGYRSTHAPPAPPETRPAPTVPAKLPPRPPAPVAVAPPPPPPSPPPAPEPPPPAEYVLEVVTTPAGATVTAGGTTVMSPGTLHLGKLDTAVEVAAEKTGFMRTVAAIDRVGFEAENGEMRRTLALTLAPLPPPPKPVAVAAPTPPPPPPKPAPVVTSTKPTPIAVLPATPKPVRPAPEAAPPTKPAPVATMPAPAPKPEPAPKPAPVKAEPAAKEPAVKPFDAARECLAKGDNECVISALEGKAKTAREMELLVETYRALGNDAKAKTGMQTYVKRFPDEKRAATYQRILDGQ